MPADGLSEGKGAQHTSEAQEANILQGSQGMARDVVPAAQFSSKGPLRKHNQLEDTNVDSGRSRHPDF
jgi:hypothetical protein